MTSQLIALPAPGEYAPYYSRYIDPVRDEDVLAALKKLGKTTAQLLAGISEGRAMFRYAPGKWSIKEIVGHLTDAERVFSYRAVCIARGETAPLPGFDENAYVDQASFDSHTLVELASDLAATRSATVGLFERLNAAELARVGTANGKPISVRALAFIILGHERHHLRVLNERYLDAKAGT
jgi:DinB superfamily